jgi:hypothetical protein
MVVNKREWITRRYQLLLRNREITKGKIWITINGKERQKLNWNWRRVGNFVRIRRRNKWLKNETK